MEQREGDDATHQRFAGAGPVADETMREPIPVAIRLSGSRRPGFNSSIGMLANGGLRREIYLFFDNFPTRLRSFFPTIKLTLWSGSPLSLDIRILLLLLSRFLCLPSDATRRLDFIKI
jgi:hypothetical protein